MSTIILSQITKNELVSDIAAAVFEKLQIQTIPPPTELVKMSEACKMLGVSRTTLKEWRDEGFIPFQQIRTRIYFKKGDILNAGLRKHKARK